jgi:hypothetical protein
MVNKKAQVKIQQTAFMLMAITLLFVLVGLFFLSTRFSGLKKTTESLAQKNAILLASKLADSPEFSCGESYGTEKSNCVDLDKVLALSKNLVDYEDFWGVSNIEIRLMVSEDEKLCSQENYPDCNVFRLISDEIKGADASNFVSVCRKAKLAEKSYNKCEVGRLIISYE